MVHRRTAVGILAQELDRRDLEEFPPGASCFIAASYAKFISGCGADVVPLMIGQPMNYYEEVMAKLNGVLLPGGALCFDEDGYGGAGMKVYKIAKQLNDNHDYFPLWGTCLGHQLLVHSSAGGLDLRGDVNNLDNSNRHKSTLKFHKDFRLSRMFGQTDQQTIDLLQTKSDIVTFHHRRCIDADMLRDDGKVDTPWRILSTSSDFDGKEFVAAIEAEKYPFYGVQFHPEKNLYEQNNTKIPVNTDDDAVRINRSFGEFFVSECEKNKHCFHNDIDRDRILIDIFELIDTSTITHSNYQECYFFE